MIFSELIDLIFEKLINLPIYVWILTIFIISFTDSLFSPIPPDPLLIFSTTYHPDYLWLFIFICVSASYLGGLTSYLLAKKVYKKYTNFIHKFINKDQFSKASKEFSKRGDLIILICAITFIPYKIIAWVAGFVEYNISRFSILTIFGRSLRYALIGILSYIFGENIQNIIQVSLDISNYLAVIFILISISLLLAWNFRKKNNTKA